MPKIRVDFWLSGNFFEPDEITKTLGVEPTKVIRKHASPLPQSASTFWKLSTLKDDCKAVCWQFEKLMNVLRDKVNTINDLCKQLELTASFTIIVEMEIGDAPELVLTQDIIAFVADLKAEIGFDMYID